MKISKYMEATAGPATPTPGSTPIEAEIRAAEVICMQPGAELNHSHAARPQNARLIAAAPDLLAVAKGCLGYFEYMKAQRSDFTPDEDWLAPLREAIAKAEGSDGK